MQSFIKKLVWLCLGIIPFLALYVADGGTLDVLSSSSAGLFFPFISGKNIVFRVLVEVAFAGWAILAIREASYRVNFKKAPLMIAYMVFMVVIFFADIFGVDRDRSIWSNFERMEGFVGHVHLFAYFVVLTAMIASLKDWRNMFKVFIASDILVLIYGYGQLLGAKGYIFADNFPKMAEWFSTRFPIHMSANRLDATIGNSAYFAIFCLMSACIAGLLWSQSKSTKLSWGYPVLIVLNLIGLFYSGTRGTMIGLIGGIIVTLSLIAWHERGHFRKVLISTLVAMIVIVGSLFAFKDSSFVQSSPTLARFASISPTDVTSSSRIHIWKISYEAWLERPMLGYGQDNFSYIFARKFNPEKMWGLESWYDRSHDVFFDWLVAGGILGLTSYLSLYVVALWLMWRKKNDMPVREKAIITGTIAGYFIHNIFVFDNLTSYILFLALLAYIVVRTKGEHEVHQGKTLASNDQINYVWAPAIVIALLISLYYVNYRPLAVNNLLVNGLNIGQLTKTMPFTEAVKVQEESFTKAIAMNTLGSEEAREQFLQMVVRVTQVNIPEGVTQKDKEEIMQVINNLVKTARDDITSSLPSHKEDVRMLSVYGMFYNGIGDPVSAEEALIMAHEIAPKKQLISFELIRSYLMERKYPQAYALGRETYDLAPEYPDATKWYLLSAAYAHAFKEARAYIISNGRTIPFDGDVLNALVVTGQTSIAIEILQEVKKSNPQYGPQVDEYIKQILAPKK
ncbi:MAG: O-antigen ligase family protein [Candidatus Paceibacterota bacterium]|jgi:O-antigen ligase